MLEIQKEPPEQRLNFTGDSTNSQFPHHNNNFNNNVNITTVDSGFPPPPPPPPINYSTPLPPPPPRKRPWGASSDQVDVPTGHVKLYVAQVPRTASEADVRLVFEGYGTIVEVVLLRDKLTGSRQGSCFVKYSTFNEADMAMKALNNQYTFPGESFPVVVRFADRDRERFGVRGFNRNLEKKDTPEEFVDKVFVNYINKEASKQEIEEIFSPYGHVEDVFISRNRGFCFVKFSHREMALAAIKGLDRTFTMRGCDHPFIVRFADPPKKPRTGESRGNYLPANANYAPNSQEPAVWPPSNFCDANPGGSNMHNAPHHPRLPHPQFTAPIPNWEPGAPLVQQQFFPQQVHSQLASKPSRPIQAPNLPSQPFITEVQRQFHPADSLVKNLEPQLSSQPTQTERNNTVAGSTFPDLSTNPQDEDFPECDWSEHYCPDGNKYYYNCVTYESRWEKPEEYALYDKEESQKQLEQDNHSVLQPQLSSSSSQEVSQNQQETNHDHMETETSPVVGQV